VITPWVTYDEIPAPVPTLPGGEEDWDLVIAQASEALWALSGRRWAGVTTRTVEVVAPAAADPSPASWGGLVAHPHVVAGEIINHACCPAPTSVRLPGTPSEIYEVTVGSTVRDPDSYRLNGDYLEDRTRTGWPICDPGLVVTYTDGREPPQAGRRAAATLAREMARAWLGDPACGLPANVTSVTRQGITQAFVPASQIIALGQTGVVPVDLWLATVNPAKLTRRARAWSPDTQPRTYRRTS